MGKSSTYIVVSINCLLLLKAKLNLKYTNYYEFKNKVGDDIRFIVKQKIADGF